MLKIIEPTSYKLRKTQLNIKGDDNDTVDDWEVPGYTIEGVIRFNIRYVGWPAVWFNTLVS